MSDQKQKTVPAWAIGLFIALAVIVGVESSWLYRLYEKNASPDNPQLQVGDTTTTAASVPNGIPLTPAPLAPDDALDPFLEMQRMQAQMNKLFGSALSKFGSIQPFLDEDPTFGAGMDVNESKDSYTVKVDLPGVQSNKINTTLHGQTLTVAATEESDSKNQSSPGNNTNAMNQSHRIKSIERSIVFRQPVTSDGMKQELHGDVLVIHVPKIVS